MSKFYTGAATACAVVALIFIIAAVGRDGMSGVSYTDVMDGISLDVKEFFGWNSAEGRIYYKGEKI